MSDSTRPVSATFDLGDALTEYIGMDVNEAIVQQISEEMMREMDKQLLKAMSNAIEPSRDMYEKWARSNPQMDEGYNHFMEHFEPTPRKLREL